MVRTGVFGNINTKGTGGFGNLLEGLFKKSKKNEKEVVDPTAKVPTPQESAAKPEAGSDLREYAKTVDVSDPDSVRKLQQQMRDAGYVGKDGKPIAVDGVFGENSLKALRDVQGGTASQGAQASAPPAGEFSRQYDEDKAAMQAGTAEGSLRTSTPEGVAPTNTGYDPNDIVTKDEYMQRRFGVSPTYQALTGQTTGATGGQDRNILGTTKQPNRMSVYDQTEAPSEEAANQAPVSGDPTFPTRSDGRDWMEPTPASNAVTGTYANPSNAATGTYGRGVPTIDATALGGQEGPGFWGKVGQAFTKQGLKDAGSYWRDHLARSPKRREDIRGSATAGGQAAGQAVRGAGEAVVSGGKLAADVVGTAAGDIGAGAAGAGAGFSQGLLGPGSGPLRAALDEPIRPTATGNTELWQAGESTPVNQAGDAYTAVGEHPMEVDPTTGQPLGWHAPYAQGQSPGYQPWGTLPPAPEVHGPPSPRLRPYEGVPRRQRPSAFNSILDRFGFQNGGVVPRRYAGGGFVGPLGELFRR